MLFLHVNLMPEISLLAIMLSRLRMNVEDCIEEYLRFGGHVFGHPRSISIPFFRPKYDNSMHYRRRIQDLVRDNEQRTEIDEPLFQSNPERAKT
jgi:hypothetical protein